MAAASWSDDVLFTHNDSGDRARFFAIDARTCATRATFTLRAATNDDWEDMARGTAADGTTVLWLADIGDNQASRSSVVVYEVAEPGPSGATGAVPVRERWTLTYPDGARDAEALLVDPETGRPLIVTKDVSGGRSRAYRVPAAGSGVLDRLAELDVRTLEGGDFTSAAASVTAGATSPDRRAVVLRTYLSAWIWRTAPGEPLATALARPPETLDPPATRQPEAVSFTRDGTGLWTTTEGAEAPLHRIPLDAASPDTAVTPPSAQASGDDPVVTAPAPSAPGPSLALPIALAGAVILAGAGVALWARRR